MCYHGPDLFVLRSIVVLLCQEPWVDMGIQGVTGGTDQTSGECSLGQTIPI